MVDGGVVPFVLDVPTTSSTRASAPGETEALVNDVADDPLPASMRVIVDRRLIAHPSRGGGGGAGAPRRYSSSKSTQGITFTVAANVARTRKNRPAATLGGQGSQITYLSPSGRSSTASSSRDAVTVPSAVAL